MPLFRWSMSGTGNDTQTYREVLPSLVVGPTERVLVWPTPFLDDQYVVTTGIAGGPTILGKLSAVIKAGTQTATGVTIVINNDALLTLAAGAELHVVGAGRVP